MNTQNLKRSMEKSSMWKVGAIAGAVVIAGALCLGSALQGQTAALAAGAQDAQVAQSTGSGSGANVGGVLPEGTTLMAIEDGSSLPEGGGQADWQWFDTWVQTGAVPEEVTQYIDRESATGTNANDDSARAQLVQTYTAKRDAMISYANSQSDSTAHALLAAWAADAGLCATGDIQTSQITTGHRVEYDPELSTYTAELKLADSTYLDVTFTKNSDSDISVTQFSTHNTSYVYRVYDIQIEKLS